MISGRKLVCLLVVVVPFVGAGCGQQAKVGGTFNSSLFGGDPGKLAFDIGTSDAAQVSVNLFDGLTELNAKTGATAPKVAERWNHNKDFTTWTFKLKRDYKFCNGEPVTSESFKAGWAATINPGQKTSIGYHFAGIKGTNDAGSSKNLTGVTTPDKYTLKVELKKGDNIFDAKVAHPAFHPVPVKYYASHKKDFAKKPVGNGPFCVTSYKSDQAIETKTNRYYSGKDRTKPKLAHLNFKIYASVGASWKAFRAGEIQDSQTPNQDFKLAAKLPNAQFVSEPLLSVYYYGFKVNQKPWNGKSGRLLRQAINYAIDRKNIVDNVWDGNATVATGFTPPGVPGYRKDLSPYNYDPAKAKKLLAQAGYPGGKGLATQTLGYNTGVGHEQVASAVQKDLSEIGVKMKPKGVADFVGTYIPQITAGKIPFFRLAWVADYNRYQNFLQPNFDSATIPEGDLQYWRNKEFDGLLARAGKAAGKAAGMSRANELYRKAEKVLFEDPPIAPIFFQKSARTVSDKIGGYERRPDDTTPYEKVYLKG